MRILRAARPFLLLAAAIALAAGSGFLASTALGTGAAAPARTVTISVANGAPGPAGPAGPAGPKGETGATGPAGASQCPAGFSAGELVFNHPGGQVAIWTCLQD